MVTNLITGKVIQKETNLALSDLLVVAYNVYPGGQLEQMIAHCGAENRENYYTLLNQSAEGERLGSTLTRSDGSFEITYEDEDYRVLYPDAKRPDLFVAVLAPEGADSAINFQILFSASTIRKNAGRTENYAIRLTQEQLEAAGIPLPTTRAEEVEQADKVIDRVAKADLRLKAINDGFRLVDKSRVEEVRQVVTQFQSSLGPAIRRMLSRIPDAIVDESGPIVTSGGANSPAAAHASAVRETYVASDDSVSEKKHRGYPAGHHGGCQK